MSSVSGPAFFRFLCDSYECRRTLLNKIKILMNVPSYGASTADTTTYGDRLTFDGQMRDTCKQHIRVRSMIGLFVDMCDKPMSYITCPDIRVIIKNSYNSVMSTIHFVLITLKYFFLLTVLLTRLIVIYRTSRAVKCAFVTFPLSSNFLISSKRILKKREARICPVYNSVPTSLS